MEQESLSERIGQLGAVFLILGLLGSLVYNAATTDGRLTIEAALKQASPKDIVCLTIRMPEVERPVAAVRLTDARTLAKWVPALQDWRAVGHITNKNPIEVYGRLADIDVSFSPEFVQASHLRHSQVHLHLDATAIGQVLWRQTSTVYYSAPIMLMRLDSLSRRLYSRPIGSDISSFVADSLGRAIPSHNYK